MRILGHIIEAINFARESRRLHLFLGSFLIATIPLAYVQRTIMLQGVGYFEYASFLLLALAALPVFFSQSTDQIHSTFYGRSLAICLLLIPFVDLPLKIGLGLLGAAGVLQFLPGK